MSVFTPIVPPVVFTPRKGLLSLGQKLAAHVGLSHLWDGAEGLGAVIEAGLDQAGVPAEISLTPMEAAKRAGVLKPKRKKRVR